MYRPPKAHDPRLEMEARREKVLQMQKSRIEERKSKVVQKREEDLKKQELLRQKQEQEEQRRHFLLQLLNKRLIVFRVEQSRLQEKRKQDMETERLRIKAKREEETHFVKQEEIKILEAHKLEVQRKLKYCHFCALM